MTVPPPGPIIAAKKKGVLSMSLSIEQFSQVELRTALVREAARVEGTDRLMRLLVDLGTEERQILAGIGGYYEPEDVVGRTVIMVANLEPATIRGVESNGMLLAASLDGKLTLLTTDQDIGPGARVR